jgi:hypothetical protein
MRDEARNSLEVVRNADQLRSSPESISSQMLQTPIVEACTAAQAPSVVVECNQRHEDQIEFANSHWCTFGGLDNAE